MKAKNNLHNELYQIVVSKRELYYQLDRCYMQRNLLKLLTSAVDGETYRRLLTLVGVKFEFVCSLNYVSKSDGKKRLRKPPEKTYERLFDGYCESAEECRMRIGCDRERAEAIFKKYSAVKKYCVKMLATTSEENYAAEFVGILDFVARNDVFPETEFSAVTGQPLALRTATEAVVCDDYDMRW